MIETPPDKVVIPQEIEALATISVDAALEVHRQLGPGLLESAYEACFAHELELRGIRFQRQLPVPLNYKGRLVEVGFRADVVIDGKLLTTRNVVEILASDNPLVFDFDEAFDLEFEVIII